MAKKISDLSPPKTISRTTPDKPPVIMPATGLNMLRRKQKMPAGQELDTKTISAKTDFGKRLLAIRNKAIKNGLTLLTNDEILAEVASGRNELP